MRSKYFKISGSSFFASIFMVPSLRMLSSLPLFSSSSQSSEWLPSSLEDVSSLSSNLITSFLFFDLDFYFSATMLTELSKRSSLMSYWILWRFLRIFSAFWSCSWITSMAFLIKCTLSAFRMHLRLWSIPYCMTVLFVRSSDFMVSELADEMERLSVLLLRTTCLVSLSSIICELLRKILD